MLTLTTTAIFFQALIFSNLSLAENQKEVSIPEAAQSHLRIEICNTDDESKSDTIVFASEESCDATLVVEMFVNSLSETRKEKYFRVTGILDDEINEPFNLTVKFTVNNWKRTVKSLLELNENTDSQMQNDKSDLSENEILIISSRALFLKEYETMRDLFVAATNKPLRPMRLYSYGKVQDQSRERVLRVLILRTLLSLEISTKFDEIFRILNITSMETHPGIIAAQEKMRTSVLDLRELTRSLPKSHSFRQSYDDLLEGLRKEFSL